MSAANHLRGRGCKSCRDDLKRAEIVATFQARHGDTFDYSRVKWIAANRKVEIICRQHGAFFQTPELHLLSLNGCSRCADETRTLTTDKWIARFQAKFGNHFDYSEVHYVHSAQKVTIGCPRHGVIEMRPDLHLRSESGCLRCGALKRRISEADVKRRLAIMHAPGKYTYEHFVYTISAAKVTVTCTAHGDFEIGAASHLNGNGCRECSGSGVSFAETSWMNSIENALSQPVERSKRLLPRISVDGYVQLSNEIALVLQYDGPYWHGRKGAYECDERISAALKKSGHTVLRLGAFSPHLAKLPNVDNAYNVSVSELPDDISVARVLSKIRTILTRNVQRTAA